MLILLSLKYLFGIGRMSNPLTNVALSDFISTCRVKSAFASLYVHFILFCLPRIRIYIISLFLNIRYTLIFSHTNKNKTDIRLTCIQIYFARGRVELSTKCECYKNFQDRIVVGPFADNINSAN